MTSSPDKAVDKRLQSQSRSRSRTTTEKVKLSFGAELARKGIHLASLWIPFAGMYWDRSVMVLSCALIALFAMWVDYERFQRTGLGLWILRHCDFMLRHHERHGKFSLKSMSGSVWLHAAAAMTFFFFPREIAVAASAMLVLCDTAAALIGKKFGKMRFGAKHKSVEGCLAFFVVGVVIVAIVPDIDPVAGVAGVFAAMLAEAFFYKIDDNFSVPLTAGVVMVLLS